MNENKQLIKDINDRLSNIAHTFPNEDSALLIRAGIALVADTEFHKELSALRMAMVELFMLKMDADPKADSKSPDVKKVKKMLKSKQRELLNVIFDFLGEDDE